MKSIRKIFLILFICALTLPSFGIDEKGEVQKAFSLKDCIEQALKNSPDIKKQKLNYEVAKKDVKIAQSVYFPTVGAGVGYNLNSTSSKSASLTSNDFKANASIKQLIWDFGKSYANIKMEEFYKIVAYNNFDTTVLNTIFSVKTKYYTLLATKAAIEIDRLNLQINERNYQRIEAYFNEGLKSKIDLVNAEVNVTQAKVSLIGSDNSYKLALSDLNNAMYLAYNPQYVIEFPPVLSMFQKMTPKSLTDEPKKLEEFLAPPKSVEDATLTAKVETQDYVAAIKMEQFPYTFEECLKIADEKRPDLKAYNATISAMKEYEKKIIRNYYPELSANGSYDYNLGKTSAGSGNDLNTFKVSVDLSTSVNGMKQYNEQKKAQLQVELAQNDLDGLKQDVYFEIQEAYIAMQEYREKIPLLEQKIAQTLENLELANGRYAVGLGDYIELQDAKVNYNTAQHAYVQGVFNYNVARAKLEEAIALDSEVTIKLEDKK